MAIQVQSEISDLTPGLKFDLERRLGRIVRKTSDSVTTVRVHFANVKSPKGAASKQCLLVLTLIGAPEVMVIARKSTVEKSFAQAIERADRALTKRRKFLQGFLTA
jgi:ribosome-associated translation inhibitor RaiA